MLSQLKTWFYLLSGEWIIGLGYTQHTKHTLYLPFNSYFTSKDDPPQSYSYSITIKLFDEEGYRWK